MIFDTHAHYDDERFNEDRFETINRVHEKGVSYILNAGADIESSIDSVKLADNFGFVFAAVGVHPHNVSDMNDETLVRLKELASSNKVVAIGEIGLDYYYDNSPRDDQKYWFSRQINLAGELGLPIIIHDRDAHEDTMNIVKREKAKEVGGVFHCYAGSVEMARDVLNNNFYIAVGGAVTFKNAKRILEVVKYVPNDRLLIETDCPYMTPEPYRGKRNDSGYLGLVIDKISELKGITSEEVSSFTMENAKRLFNIR